MTAARRKKIQAIQKYLVEQRAHIGYRQLRPMKSCHIVTMAELEAYVTAGCKMDCSEIVTLVMHVAGAKSPSGSYNCYGNTETMLEHLPHYTDARHAYAGALAIFNANLALSRQHVAQVHQADALHGNPLMFSHGDAAGPGLLRLAALQTGFSGETVFLSVVKL